MDKQTPEQSWVMLVRKNRIVSASFRSAFLFLTFFSIFWFLNSGNLNEMMNILLQSLLHSIHKKFSAVTGKLNDIVKSKRHFSVVSNFSSNEWSVTPTELNSSSSVNSLRDQLEDMKKRNQNSHISNEKNIHLQKQVSHFPSNIYLLFSPINDISDLFSKGDLVRCGSNTSFNCKTITIVQYYIVDQKNQGWKSTETFPLSLDFRGFAAWHSGWLRFSI